MDKTDIEKIKKEAAAEIEKAADLKSLQELRWKYLGRSGAVSEILSGLKNLPAQDRAKAGKAANELKIYLEARFQEKTSALESGTEQAGNKKDWLDITRPGEKLAKGRLHPLTKITRKVENIFSSMGFET
ncbi:MAG: phenylalanine--tRNA ligase subunit alpha, partial [Patescibacteria group bacterium]